MCLDSGTWVKVSGEFGGAKSQLVWVEREMECVRDVLEGYLLRSGGKFSTRAYHQKNAVHIGYVKRTGVNCPSCACVAVVFFGTNAGVKMLALVVQFFQRCCDGFGGMLGKTTVVYQLETRATIRIDLNNPHVLCRRGLEYPHKNFFNGEHGLEGYQFTGILVFLWSPSTIANEL